MKRFFSRGWRMSMPPDNMIPENEDKVAFPEARIVKYQYLSDYYDAKESIVKYLKTGERKYILKATNSILGMWLQLKPEFEFNELKMKRWRDVAKIDYFLENRSKMPSYELLLKMFFLLQSKLKKMRVLEITFPEADIGKDFQRSF
jgi:hypothetical protein